MDSRSSVDARFQSILHKQKHTTPICFSMQVFIWLLLYMCLLDQAQSNPNSCSEVSIANRVDCFPRVRFGCLLGSLIEITFRRAILCLQLYLFISLLVSRFLPSFEYRGQLPWTHAINAGAVGSLLGMKQQVTIHHFDFRRLHYAIISINCHIVSSTIQRVRSQVNENSSYKPLFRLF